MKINFHGHLIDRSKIPDSIKWLAQDGNGAVFGYAGKPIAGVKSWSLDYTNNYEFVYICILDKTADWKETLMSIEEVNDSVNHPAHYEKHPSGVECIEIVRHMNFNLGNAIKYLWRAGKKDPAKTIEDLNKAIWYIQDETERLKEHDNSNI